MKRIVIFASGSGSNADIIAQFFKNHITIAVSNLICNKKDAAVIQKFKNHQIPYTIINKDELLSVEFCNYLSKLKPDLIVLSGFLLKIPKLIVKNFPNKIINIHPSLLPKFGGKGMYGIHVHKAVFNAKEQYTGITIHYVNEQYDEGQIILQKSINIQNCQSVQEIADAVLLLEHANFAPTIEKILLNE